MTAPLSAAELARLNTWIVRLVETCLHSPAYTDTGDERRYHDLGLALQINKVSGAWFSWNGGGGSWSAYELLTLLCPGGDNEAFEYARAFLASHLGDGDQRGRDDEELDEAHETRRLIHTARVREVLDRMVPVERTRAETYLVSRKLPPPYPEGLLGFLPDARTGEDALVARLTWRGRTTGIQMLFLDALDGKSVQEPVRQRFDLERAPGAYFDIQSSRGRDEHADCAIAEGLEDGLSVMQIGRPWRIIALPGVNTLRHLETARKTRVLVIADGDEPGSAAERGLSRGIDHLVLNCEAIVYKAQAPAGKDANSFLLDCGSLDPLRTFLAGAAGAKEEAKFSAAGVAEQLSRLEPLEAAGKIATAAKDAKIPTEALRREVKRLRREHDAVTREKKRQEAEEKAAGIRLAPPDPPWTDPLPDLGEILGRVREQVDHYVMLSPEQVTAVTLWIAASHLVHSQQVRLEVFPKLAVQSQDPNSGKSTLLLCLWNTIPHAKLWTNPSGAFLARALEQGQPSLCLDELQYADDKNLLRIIDASHLRALAQVPLLVPNSVGGWVPREYDVWGPMALARLGEFSRAQQSRSIVIWMIPKLPSEKRARLRPVIVADLIHYRRQLAAWAETMTTWKAPVIPDELRNRDLDNWEPLLFVAEAAGAEWTAQAHQAVAKLIRVEYEPTLTTRLLASVWKIFQPDPEQAPRASIPSEDLRVAMINDQDEDWYCLGPGSKEITHYFLRRNLSPLLDPRGTQQENYRDDKGVRRNRQVYTFAQIKDALERHVGVHPLSPSKNRGDSPPSSPSSPSASEDRSKTEDISKSYGSFSDADHPLHFSPKQASEENYPLHQNPCDTRGLSAKNLDEGDEGNKKRMSPPVERG